MGLLTAASVAALIFVSPQTDGAPAATATAGLNVEIPALPGATVDPTCGELYNLAGRAFCVTAPLANIGALAEAYITHFEGQGWLPAGGDDNRVVFVKRLDGGGCAGMQLQAFYDTSRNPGASSPGYIAMAEIPGNVCAAPSAQTTPPAPQ